MIEYSLIYAKPINSSKDNILVILKTKGEQEGYLNLPGGKIYNEDIIDGAVRELKEETGLSPISKPLKMGEIIGEDYLIHCIKTPVVFERIDHKCPEGIVSWMDWLEIKDSHILFPSLKVVVPLMAMGVINWKYSKYKNSIEI